MSIGMYMQTSSVTGGRCGHYAPLTLFTGKFLLINQEKRGKEKRKNGEERKENCKRKRERFKMEGGKVWKWAEELFFSCLSILAVVHGGQILCLQPPEPVWYLGCVRRACSASWCIGVLCYLVLDRGNKNCSSQFLEPLKLVWDYQNGNFYHEKSISRQEKLGKLTPLPEKWAVSYF